jgi:hypothetical protein
MKKKLFPAITVIMVAGLISCQKDKLSERSSFETNLYTSVAEITGIQISTITGSVEHSLAVEKYDGYGYAHLLGNDFGPGFIIPGWGIPGVGHLKFAIPHIDSCATVTVSSNTYPKEIVVEYLKGCSTHHHDKYGKVIITLSDTITNTGAIQTVVYQDFYIDSIKVNLNATLKNMGQNSSGNWVIEKSYTQTITKNGEVCVREVNENQEWISGFGTAEKSDDICYLSGSGSITVNDTAYYSKTITTPLLYDASCDYITSGVVELERNGSLTIIDYGDGTCDDKATVTSNGTTEEISLHSKKFREGMHSEKHFSGFGDRGR